MTQQSNVAASSPPISEFPKCGFDVENLDKINPRFKCIFCDLVIREPIQLSECGHRSCRECFELRAAKTIDENITCPVADCEYPINNKNQVEISLIQIICIVIFLVYFKIMSDKAFRKESNGLRIGCKYREKNECSWEGILQDYQVDRLNFFFFFKALIFIETSRRRSY